MPSPPIRQLPRPRRAGPTGRCRAGRTARRVGWRPQLSGPRRPGPRPHL